MSRSACWCLSAILPLCCAAGLPAVAAVPRVNDEARFFSPAAVEKGDRKIGDIARQFHRELLIETAPGIPDRLQEKYKELGKRAFFEGWTRQRAEEAGIRGIYILICKTPSHLQIVVDRSTRQRAFTREDEDRLTRKTIELLSAHKNDDALLAAVDFVAATLADNSGRSGPLDRREHVGVGPVRPQPQAMPPLGGGANLFGGSSLSGWLCIAAAVFLGLWLLKSIFGAITGTGRSMGGMGGGGMGPGGMGGGGYGGGGGGGFLSSMLGGIFGAAAGNWLYDSFRGGGPSQGFGGGSPSGSDYTGDNSGAGDFSGDSGAGGDFGDASQDSGGGDSGGGDAGGGGDFGGGADFGGGGGFGGGGDSGGGGGDFG
jgi:uncharacterized protein